eukprot:scaffold187_cov140-Skeletonema_marinoi.AAC.19
MMWLSSEELAAVSDGLTRCFATIMANYNGSLEAVDCDIHSVRYDMVLERSVGGRLRCPHQVIFVDVAMSIQHK